MCGRFVLAASREAVESLFEVEISELYEQRFNIAPTQPVLFVHQFQGQLQADFARWGLIPHWHKDPKTATLLINARSETVIEKPSFKTAIRHRRVLVPATNFYEWKRDGRHKRPFAAKRKQPDGADGLFAFAGIVDEWSDGDGGVLSSLAILTQEALGPIAHIHHRLPVVVPKSAFREWLDCPAVSPQEALELTQQIDQGGWDVWPVDQQVNKATAEGAALLREASQRAAAPEETKRQLDLF
ncbi:MAG: SOS response-associated peptidase [Pseudomonadota bacterium]